MDKEKEINDLNKTLTVEVFQDCGGVGCEECYYNPKCQSFTYNYAERLFEAGYRKASDVACETAKAIFEDFHDAGHIIRIDESGQACIRVEDFSKWERRAYEKYVKAAEQVDGENIIYIIESTWSGAMWKPVALHGDIVMATDKESAERKRDRLEREGAGLKPRPHYRVRAYKQAEVEIWFESLTSQHFPKRKELSMTERAAARRESMP